MLRPRVIVCLDVKDGRVVKGTQFKGLRDVGDPVELAARYEAEGADEIVFLDVSASKEGRGTLLDTVRRTAETLFIPLTVGGGVRSPEDIGPLLRAGADKISVNTAAVFNPEILTLGAERFGSQCIVASIDAAREGGGWRCYTHGGSRPTELDALRGPPSAMTGAPGRSSSPPLTRTAPAPGTPWTSPGRWPTPSPFPSSRRAAPARRPTSGTRSPRGTPPPPSLRGSSTTG